MSHLPSVTGVQVETQLFPPTVKPPGTTNTLFLAGAGVRSLYIQGKLVKFTAIGVYLEDSAVGSLAVKWKGKTAEELTESVEFFRDVVTEKVAENCVAHWKAVGIYTDAEANAIEKFLEIFKDQTFQPGSSILFTHLPDGSLTISFSKDHSMPEGGNVVIKNKHLAEAILESIIGKHGVSPAARQSLAVRVLDLLKQFDDKAA